MSFEVQDLRDLIRIIILLEIKIKSPVTRKYLKKHIDKICSHHLCVDSGDIDKALVEMSGEKLVVLKGETLELTEQGVRLSREWRTFLLKRESILEVVAGLTDGSITGLVVILSSFFGSISIGITIFAAFLTLAAVAITNFSSFFLGGVTEDYSSMINLSNLLNFSLSDNPDKKERDKSLKLLEELLTLLKENIRYNNGTSAVICGVTTFLAGSLPIGIYLVAPEPYNLILSLALVIVVVGIFLVKYRAKQSKTSLKITLFETIIIFLIAVVASLILGYVF